MKKFIIATLMGLLTFTGAASASTLENKANSRVNRVISYTQLGNGDVFLSLEGSGSQCSYGYFLSKSDPGFDSTLSTLLAAYHAGANVTVIGDSSNMWSSSTQPVCKLFALETGD